jgi:hypothetical protein
MQATVCVQLPHKQVFEQVLIFGGFVLQGCVAPGWHSIVATQIPFGAPQQNPVSQLYPDVHDAPLHPRQSFAHVLQFSPFCKSQYPSPQLGRVLQSSQ